MTEQWHVILPMISIIGIGLIGLIWRNLSVKVDTKVDKALYAETMIHIQKAVEGINGTAQTLKTLARDISDIQDKFMTRKDFEYELRLHHSECPVVKQVAELLSENKKSNK